MVLSGVFVLLVGFGAGAALYWTTRKELAETIKTADEAARARDQIRQRLALLSDIQGLIDAYNALTGAPRRKRGQHLGSFLSTGVEAAARLMRELQADPEVAVRAIVVRYDELHDLLEITGQEVATQIGPVPDQHVPSLLRYGNDSDFAKAARKLIKSGIAFRQGDRNTIDLEPDLRDLRLPDKVDHYIRIPLVSGSHHHGLLCIDTWRTTVLAPSDLQPALIVASILSAGLTTTASKEDSP